jgi:hypothetical protein
MERRFENMISLENHIFQIERFLARVEKYEKINKNNRLHMWPAFKSLSATYPHFLSPNRLPAADFSFS